ncbi:cation:proton antiporter [Nocardioides sp. YIM 152315]|uniref:cation:proton antiporter n=1 Tax=Nocardioides sp. YIM 152315 TaxID=3031760 RepID=UPI0023DBFAE8|nr:cation:proton antiporter [Nocardioides sp. YIM 152315]MDF1605801.1 cation:proton antiporter [Nocardioides sp. YIM 152315]
MTVYVLVFGVALLLAVLTSAVADRSPLSTSTVFLAVGLIAGPLGLGLIEVESIHVEHAAEVTLFAILFTDGQHAPLKVVAGNWRAPAQALVIGMPLTFLIVAGLGHWIAGLPWTPALVLGAVLAPTDPVFASALVGRDDVPPRVRHTLNIESGLNDGLALPAVLLLAGLAGGDPESWTTDPWLLLTELGTGVALGVVLPVAIAAVLRLPGIGAVEGLRPLGPLAVALILYGACDLLHANQFLAAFIAGATIATIRPAASDAFRRTGDLVSELAKGGALLAFATLLDVEVFTDAGVAGVVLALAVVLVSRPLPAYCSLFGTDLTRRERLAVSWFGPKGFASVAYAVIVAFSDMDADQHVFALVTVAVLVSVVAHSSTDVAVARVLARDSVSPAPSRPAYRRR